MKLRLLALFILLSVGASAQTWQNFGANGVQRKINGTDTLYRWNGGASGFLYGRSEWKYDQKLTDSLSNFYTKNQVDGLLEEKADTSDYVKKSGDIMSGQLTVGDSLSVRANGPSLIKEGTSIDIYPAHQGLANDGTNTYMFDTQAIYKKDEDLATIATNSTPFAGVNVNLNHLGDGDYYNGKLYTVAEKFDGTASYQHIIVYNDDLSLDSFFDISSIAGDREQGAIKIVNDTAYVVDYFNGSRLNRYLLPSFTALPDLLLDKKIDVPQGIEYLDGKFYVSNSEGKIYSFALDGKVSLAYFTHVIAYEYEGLDNMDGNIRYLTDFGTTANLLILSPSIDNIRSFVADKYGDGHFADRLSVGKLSSYGAIKVKTPGWEIIGGKQRNYINGIHVGVDDINGALATNAYYDGSRWIKEDQSKSSLALIQSMVNNRVEFRFSYPNMADSVISWKTYYTLDSSFRASPTFGQTANNQDFYVIRSNPSLVANGYTGGNVYDMLISKGIMPSANNTAQIGRSSLRVGDYYGRNIDLLNGTFRIQHSAFAMQRLYRTTGTANGALAAIEFANTYRGAETVVGDFGMGINDTTGTGNSVNSLIRIRGLIDGSMTNLMEFQGRQMILGGGFSATGTAGLTVPNSIAPGRTNYGVYYQDGSGVMQSLQGNGLLKLNTSSIPTVAIAGTDYVVPSALTGYVPTTRTLTAGYGINTLGDLSANRTITLDSATLSGKYIRRNEISSNTGLTQSNLVAKVSDVKTYVDNAISGSTITVANGTWTPASATVTLTVNFTYYQRVANMVTAFFDISFPVSASGSAVAITGLPLAPYNYYPLNISVNESGLNIYGETATTGGSILLSDNTHTAITYTQMSGKRLSGSVTYRIP